MSRFKPYEEPEKPMYPYEPTTESQEQKWYKKNGNRRKRLRRNDMSPEVRKNRCIKDWIITGSVFGALFVIIGVFALTNFVGLKDLVKYSDSFNSTVYAEGEQLTPQKDADGYYTFTTDEDFKILQLTDIHIGGGFTSRNRDKWALNAVAAMVTAEKPDLVILTGDMAYPVPFQAGTFNNMSATKIIATLMEKLGVYWTFNYGNHDTEAYSYYSREDLCEYYESQNFRYCLFERGFSGEDAGYGNSIIKVKNSAGLTTQAIVIMDSHSYTDGDIFGMMWKYDNIQQCQVDWYSAEINKINAANATIDENAAPVKNLAFIHIPLVEYRDAWKQYTEVGHDTDDVKVIYNTVGGPEGKGENDNTKNGVRTYRVYCGYGEDEFFETGLECNLQGVFCGHDHYNSFSVEYKGIRLTYGLSIDYLAYPGIADEQVQRGCTIITVSPDGTFECVRSNYYQEKYAAQYVKK